MGHHAPINLLCRQYQEKAQPLPFAAL